MQCNLSLPADIPWRRICVSEDMLDAKACDQHLPPKWHSSIAVFRYDPPDEYQEHDGYVISYLKVAVTLTGYQPHDKEIEGQLDWSGLSTDDIEDVEDLLGQYLPCTGAILQVSVSSQNQNVEPPESPFFLDFEPKRRSLYEMATDTSERASRSLETLNVSKSGGSAESTEVLDVDMGGSQSIGLSGGAEGITGGINAASSRQGQWGTKMMGSETQGNVRTTDHSRDKRESQAFTTQLSQLYQLLDTYHVGTNRAIFFVQPRPHVLEQPSGFVRGPRPVEGIQEFFLVIARPKDQADYCVAARLDTAHLTEVELFEHERRTDQFECSVSAPAPTRSQDLHGPHAAEAKEEPDVILPLTFLGEDAGERIYKCHSITRTETGTYQSPFSDFRIDPDDPYEVLDQSESHGSIDISVSSNGESLTAVCGAKSNYCYNYGGDTCFGCPAFLNSWDAHARVRLQVNLTSREPVKSVGFQKVLLVTTRGVCCCPEGSFKRPLTGVVTTVPVGLVVSRYGNRYGIRIEDLHEKPRKPDDVPPGVLSVKVANALGELLSNELRQLTSRPHAYDRVGPLVYTDYFINRLQARRRQRPGFADWGQQRVRELVERFGDQRAEEYFGKPAKQVSRRDLLARSNHRLAEGLGISRQEAALLRLGALGLKFMHDASAEGKSTSRSTS